MTAVPEKETDNGVRRRRGEGRRRPTDPTDRSVATDPIGAIAPSDPPGVADRQRSTRPWPFRAVAPSWCCPASGCHVSLPVSRTSTTSTSTWTSTTRYSASPRRSWRMATDTAVEVSETEGEARRRRRRRGGRGRGRGRRGEGELATGEPGEPGGSGELVTAVETRGPRAPREAVDAIDADLIEDEYLETEVATLPQHSTFGSVWESQLGAAPAPAISGSLDDQEGYDDEPEIPEYLLAERRQQGRARGGRDQRPGNRGGAPGNRAGGYRTAVDRERYGRTGSPSTGGYGGGSGGNTSGGNRSDRQPDRNRGGQPGQGGRGQAPARQPRPANAGTARAVRAIRAPGRVGGAVERSARGCPGDAACGARAQAACESAPTGEPGTRTGTGANGSVHGPLASGPSCCGSCGGDPSRRGGCGQRGSKALPRHPRKIAHQGRGRRGPGRGVRRRGSARRQPRHPRGRAPRPRPPRPRQGRPPTRLRSRHQPRHPRGRAPRSRPPRPRQGRPPTRHRPPRLPAVGPPRPLRPRRVRAETDTVPATSGRLLTRGHPLASAAVRRAIRRGRAPHAILLVGPRAVGKTTLAMDLAAGLLCLAPDPAVRPCRLCAACRKVEHGNHPDLHRLQPEGAGEQIRIGQVQALVTDLALLPMEGRVRVAVIESAHRMNPDAQNALAQDARGARRRCVHRALRRRSGHHPAHGHEPIGTIPAGPGAGQGHRGRCSWSGGLADAARAAGLATASGGLPGVAIALSRSTDALLIRDRLARQLADLLGADARTRLDVAASLMADGAALEAALAGQPPDAETDGEPPAAAPRRRTASTSVIPRPADAPAPARGASSRRPPGARHMARRRA